MADTAGAFSIDLPMMSTVTSDLTSLFGTGQSALGELGSLVLEGEAFGQIGSVVGSVDGQLHDSLLSSLTSGMGLFGNLNGALQCCASDYAALDTMVSDSFASLGIGGTLPTTPTAGTSPADVNKWWSGLSGDQQNALVASDPAKIGAMDGVPDTVRDTANRTVLSTLQTQTQQQITDLKNTPTNPYDDYRSPRAEAGPDRYAAGQARRDERAAEGAEQRRRRHDAEVPARRGHQRRRPRDRRQRQPGHRGQRGDGGAGREHRPVGRPRRPYTTAPTPSSPPRTRPIRPSPPRRSRG